MNSITKTSAVAIAFVAVVFGIGVFALTSDVFAFGDSNDGGCCSDSNLGGDDYNPPMTNGGGGCTSNCNPPRKEYGKCDSFTASPTQLSHGGDDVTLTWRTTNADRVTINQGIGSVADDGSTTVFVGSSKTFVLTVDGKDGDDTCQVSVKVKEQEKHLSCDLFTVSKSRVEKGENFTLRWETTDATSVSINQGIGSVSSDGSRTESVNHDTTYTLTASNDHDTVTCHVSVKIDEDDHDDDDKLRCELDISDDEIERGDSVRLSWETEGGDEILLKDDRGNVIVDTDDGDDYDVDEDDIRVKPTRDTEYRLTVFDGNDKETCEVEVEVDEDDRDVSVKTKRDQDPIIIGIPLTHVPYTGFEAGPVLTALFYALLAVWGLAVAYILVVKRGSIFGFALPAKGTETVQSTMTAAEPVHTPVYDYAPAVEAAPASALDVKAHDARVLLSNDARAFIRAQAETEEEQLAILDSVIANAKATFPTENGWVVLNKTRVEELLG